MKASSFYRTAVASTVSALVLAFAAPAIQAQASSAIDSQNWSVFVDSPTRFAFVKAPSGWVFVRQLDEEHMTRLPASTLLTLLKEDDGAARHAQPALERSLRAQGLCNAEPPQAAVATTAQGVPTWASSQHASANAVSRAMAVDGMQPTAAVAC